MPCRINLEAMPDAERDYFLRALAREIYRIRESPELWAKVQETIKNGGNEHDHRRHLPREARG